MIEQDKFNSELDVSRGLEVFVLGTGGMMPLPYRHLVSILVRCRGKSVLFDCGEGTQVALKKAKLKWKNLDILCVSHLHADHITGLFGMLFLLMQAGKKDELKIIGPVGIKEYVKENLRFLGLRHLGYPLVVREIFDSHVPQEVFSDSLFQIRSFRAYHTKPCVGYVFEEHPRLGRFNYQKMETLGIPKGPIWARLHRGESITVEGKTVHSKEVVGVPRPGFRLAYLTDTAYHESLAGSVKEVDLLFMEAMFKEDLLDQARQKKHCTARQTAMVAQEAKVHALGLVHYSPRYQRFDLLELLKEAQNIFPQTFLTCDGYTLFPR